ncbi:MAG: hypothetical protein QG577_42 [Thermodesulfobacteriota bacterium]|nr:hypothetical protein [Thermodesulfobacteriota bacterium]
MTQSAFQTSEGASLDSIDFTHNYRNLKKIIQAIRVENGQTVGKELFGDEEDVPALTKKDLKDLFKMLRKIEHHYEECCNPPIPQALEKSIRNRDSSEWLPWELEAIEKVEIWRSDLDDRKKKAAKMFEQTLAKIKTRQIKPR